MDFRNTRFFFGIQPSIRCNDHLGDAVLLLQSYEYRLQSLEIIGVSREEFIADRNAFVIDEESHHNLNLIHFVVL